MYLMVKTILFSLLNYDWFLILDQQILKVTMDPIIYSYDWRPINVSSRVQEFTADNSRLNFNQTIVEMSNSMPESSYGYSDKFADQLNSRTIENELEILNIDALMAFVGPNNVVEMTITTMASNIIVSLGWIILGKWSSGLGN